jgi:hypothetical protein
MRLFFKNSLLFLGLLVIIYPMLVVFTGNFIPQLFKTNISYKIGAYGHLYSRIKEAKSSVKGVDLLFVGSSHAYRGFDTRNFGNIKSFNLGSSAQTPINTKVLLQRYLDKIKPKVVIYEVYPGTFVGDGVESSLDIISNDKNDIYSFDMALELNNIKTYNTFIYGVFYDCFGLNTSFKENKIINEDTYISGGYVERKLKFYESGKTISMNKWSFNEKQLLAFKEIIDIINKKRMKMILVFAPVTNKLYSSYLNNNYVDSLMQSYQLDYYNFNNLITLNDSIDFYDAHHLNQNGVNKFNIKLTEILFKNINLTK